MPAVPTGEIGGTFARSQVDTYYADINLSGPLNLSNVITATGKFNVRNISSGWTGSGAGRVLIGHFSKSATSREFVGLEIENWDTNTMIVRAHVQKPVSGNDDSEDNGFSPIFLSANDGHTFSYTYDPSLGTHGRLTLKIDNLSPIYVDIGTSTRNSGAQFDAFGIGYTSDRNTQPGATKTAEVYLDDINYSGFQSTAPPPHVGISATDPIATEYNSSTGTFTISRDNSAGDLTVNYTVSGTATNGVDYTALPGSIIIPNGHTSITVTITPVNDNLAEPSETVTLRLTPDVNYVVSPARSASVTIVDNEPTVIVAALDASAAEIGGNTGAFKITRSTSVGSLTVNYTMSGPATNGTDYAALSGSVMIPNGQTFAVLTVTPLDDAIAEGTERVVLEISPGDEYHTGAVNRATVLIADNDAPGDPNWTGSNNMALGNNYGWSDLTNFAGGVRGEIGGTLTRAKIDSYYGDVNLTSSLNMNGVITASGTFSLRNITDGWAGNGSSGFFIGHFSQSTTGHEFVGFTLKELRTDAVRVDARVQAPNGAGDDSAVWNLVSADDIHTFSYTYDPNQGAYGRLTVTIDSNLPMVIDISSSKRNSGAVLNAFGMGATPNMNSESNSTKSIDAYFDNLSYTGLQPPPQLFGDFNSDNKVDGGDYVIWRKNELANASLPNDNGLTTQAERDARVARNFGNSGGGSSSGNASAAGSADGNAGLDREGVADGQASSPVSPPATATPLMIPESSPSKSDEPAPPDDGPAPSTRSLPTSLGEIATLRGKAISIDDVSSFASRQRREHLVHSMMKPTFAAIDDRFQLDVQEIIDVRLAENDETVQCSVFEELSPEFDVGIEVWNRLFRRQL